MNIVHRLVFLSFLMLSILTTWGHSFLDGSSRVGKVEQEDSFYLRDPWEKTFELDGGEVFEISVSVAQPSQLPKNGRVGVSWTLVKSEVANLQLSQKLAREQDFDGIYTKPTADWGKTLHALDPDVYLVYRVPVVGHYRLKIFPVVDEPPVFEGVRWVEVGTAPLVSPFPRQTPWPTEKHVLVETQIKSLELGNDPTAPFQVEQEPNDTPEQAQIVILGESKNLQRVLITGGADDVEYFDNGKVGQSGDDWFRIHYNGEETRLLTCNLTLPDHTLAARLRFYALQEEEGHLKPQLQVTSPLSQQLLSLSEYTRGKNQNERVHQQNESHRSEISRLLKPGVYFLRAEANAPGYEIELRLLKPAPYSDPQMAVKQGLYDHLAQVDAWLTNRPRGASVERRIRDTGNLLGTHCMSCHTQAGVWGSAVPLEKGYQIENIQNFRRLVNVMYESLRPTNYLKEAANNTSLAPLDVGDGPAGTRVAGHNVCTLERVVPPKKLYSKQAVRAANHVLQTSDPSGINAAGPGSNVGKSVVFSFSGEILAAAWHRTNHPRYFAGMEEKAGLLLKVEPKYSDDLSHRIEFFRRFFPSDYLSQHDRASKIQNGLPSVASVSLKASHVQESVPLTKNEEEKPAEFPYYELLSKQAAKKLWGSIQKQLVQDENRLRSIQNEDGSWGFDPGQFVTEEQVWKTNGKSDPAPTALALIALEALGYDQRDQSVALGVKALLAMQKPYGLWNQSALTGFVTTGYALHALSRLFPVSAVRPSTEDFEIAPEESLLTTLKRVRNLTHTGKSTQIDQMVKAVHHPSALVRYWGVIALGGIHDPLGVPAILRALGDRVKMVRDAAAWAMEQSLLDDIGFEAVFKAYANGSDRVRESLLKALGMRADTVMTQPNFKLSDLTRLLDRALNDDPHPGVRAWASKAAWQWWIWNPPIRNVIQDSWIRRLLSHEKNALVEQCIRYQSHALFIANGHKGNASEKHQYPELASLFQGLEAEIDRLTLPTETRDLIAKRLTHIAATFYNTSGGDGGPGQMGYITPGSAEAIGKAILIHWDNSEKLEDPIAIRLSLEAAAGVPFPDLQNRLTRYAIEGPEQLRTLAAAALADPSAVMLPGSQEQVQPMVEQIYRGAQDYDRRKSLAEPVLNLMSRTRWSLPQNSEQQSILYGLLIPSFDKSPDAASMAKILLEAEKASGLLRELSPDWFIAKKMGEMLASNPDLHSKKLVQIFPKSVKNPLEAHFWLPNLNWLSTYGDPIPELVPSLIEKKSSPELILARNLGLQLLLENLKPDTPNISRQAAIKIAHLTFYRHNPLILQAVKKLLETEPNTGIQEQARNLLRTDMTVRRSELKVAFETEPMTAKFRNDQAKALMPPEFIANFEYFSDYVMPELNRPQRQDEKACMHCHGIPGRVPSMELERPDETGYLPVAKILKNYLILQERVDIQDIEKSKLLRKPLNIQTGQEDGHQGGRRYAPLDRGYQIIRRWVLDQLRVTESFIGKTTPEFSLD